jgi:hypothetical protein
LSLSAYAASSLPSSSTSDSRGGNHSMSVDSDHFEDSEDAPLNFSATSASTTQGELVPCKICRIVKVCF